MSPVALTKDGEVNAIIVLPTARMPSTLNKPSAFLLIGARRLYQYSSKVMARYGRKRLDMRRTIPCISVLSYVHHSQHVCYETGNRGDGYNEYLTKPHRSSQKSFTRGAARTIEPVSKEFEKYMYYRSFKPSNITIIIYFAFSDPLVTDYHTRKAEISFKP